MFVLLCCNKQFIDRTSLFLVEHESSTLQIPKSNIRYDLEPVPSISHVLYFPYGSFTMYVYAPSLHISCFNLHFSNLILSSFVSVKRLIKFTTPSLFGSDCFATRRPCVVHYAVHGIHIKQLYTGSSHSGDDDLTLLGYDTMQTGTSFHIPEDKNFYDF